MDRMETTRGVNVNEVTELITSKNAENILVIDCRPFIAFNQNRMICSVNIHCPPILKRRSGGFIALENIVPFDEQRNQLIDGVFSHVLVYDECTRDLTHAPKDSNILLVIKSLYKQVDNLSVGYIIGGFNAIKERCPTLCVRQELPPLVHQIQTDIWECTARLDEPAEILPHLYLGDLSHSGQHQLLQRLGITALVNVSTKCENHFTTQYRYMNVPINDNMNADLLSWFPTLIQFIDSVAAERGKVLVHCRAGISRSATVCIAYIMKKHNVSFHVAFERVMLRRPVIDPNLNFINQLQDFELQLKHQLQIPETTMPRSAPPIPRKTKSPCVFTFSSDEQLVPQSSPPCAKRARTEQSTSSTDSFTLSSIPATVKTSNSLAFSAKLSPSSLSQTAASPNPCKPTVRPRSPPVRPWSLPLLQVIRSSKTPEVLLTSPYLISPVKIVSPTSPLVDIIAQAEGTLEALPAYYGSIPRTPCDNQTFDFCTRSSVDLSVHTAPRQTSATMKSSTAFLKADSSQTGSSVSLSPLSPLGLPASPLPSFG